MSDFCAGDLAPTAIRRLLDRTLIETTERLGAHSGALYLLDPGDDVLSAEVGTGPTQQFAEPLLHLSLSAKAADPLVESVRKRQVIWIPSSEEYARRYPHQALAFPYRYAMATAALATGDASWGGMVLFWPHGRPDLAPAERQTIATATGSMAAALQAAARAGRRLIPPAEPRSIAPARRDPAQAAEAAAAAGYLARLPDGALSLAQDGRITFVNRAAADLLGENTAHLLGTRPWESLHWLRDPVYEQCYRDALVSQQPTSCTARQGPGRNLLFQLYPDPTGISVRITPTRAEHRPHGPGLPESGPFTGPTRLGSIYHLMHLAGTVAQTVDVRDVVDLVAEKFVLAFHAQAFALLVPEAGRMRIIGHQGFTTEAIERLDGTPLVPTTTPGVLGLTAGTPSFFPSHHDLAQAYPDRARLDDGMAAWAYLPLISSGVPIGTCVLGYDTPHHFTEEERRTLTAFSGLIAQALDRARLYDAERNLAHGLQDSLLPHELPTVPGLEVAVRYLPSSHGIDVGGDFYDIIRTGPSRAVIVIGDVQGHNVHAAALMGQVRTAVHAYAVAGKSPDRILARTNQLLTDLDADLLTSCLCAQIDTAHHRVRLATAGHCPPLLRHTDHRAEILGLSPGPLLGVTSTATYPTTQITLPPGAVLALHTDGLIEAPAIRDDTELTKLSATLSGSGDVLDDIADSLIDQALPTGHRTDDTALLLLRITRHTDQVA